MAVESRSTLWVDAGGNQTITRINSQGGASVIVATMLAVLNSDISQDWEGVLATASPAPTNAAYMPVTARATLLFTTTAAGVLVSLTLIAPKLAIFLADGVTVNLANADVVNLATAAVGTLCNETGDTATALIAGFLQ